VWCANQPPRVKGRAKRENALESINSRPKVQALFRIRIPWQRRGAPEHKEGDEQITGLGMTFGLMQRTYKSGH
ncbi:MAG: hypothetical protein ACRD22_14430, partial [Terriglobia bacterium]